MNKTYKEIALSKTNLKEEHLMDECPITVFKNKGAEFIERIYCDECCEECWDRKPMADAQGIKEICKKAVEKYGKSLQMDMVVEECSELIQAICKNKRGKDNRENIVEEIADIELMIEQLKLMFEITETEVEYWKYFKLERLMGKMESI